jgi:transposase-like protein
MARYSQERKDSILIKLLPPYNMSVSEVALNENIPYQTLYTWRDNAKKEGKPVPGNKSNADHWSAETKLAVIVETAIMSEAELNQYCREKGLFKEKVLQWKQECLGGFKTSDALAKAVKLQGKADQAEIKRLNRELLYKDKALAETAALLVLRKKLNTLWEDDAEES